MAHLRTVLVFLLSWLSVVSPLEAAYAHCRTVTITTHPASTLTNFPMLFQCSAGACSWLAAAASGGQVQHTTTQSGAGDQVTSFPADVAFVNSASNDCTQAALKWEWESWTSGNGNGSAWVRVPSLASGSDTVFTVCYNDSGVSTWQGDVPNTWSSYSGVWHLGIVNTVPSLHLWADSTAGGHNAEGNISSDQPTFSASGLVGGAASFALGSGGCITGCEYLDSKARLGTYSDGSGNVTLTFWIKATNAYNSNLSENPIEANSGGSAPEFTFLHYLSNQLYTGFYDGAGHDDRGPTAASASNWVAGSWQQYYMREISGGTNVVGYNGNNVIANLTNNAHVNPTNNLNFGGDPGIGRDYVGLMDEIRLLASITSADWVKAEYDSIANVASYYTLGGESSSCGGGGATNPPTNSLPRLGARNGN